MLHVIVLWSDIKMTKINDSSYLLLYITPHVDYMHTLAIAVRHNISNNIII